MVFKKLRLIGRSDENFEGAVEDAIGRAEETMDDLQWATVTDQSVQLDRAQPEYQAEVEIAFELRE
ncbi:MAG: dodecin domain-containing protein [Halapricum sp.]